MEEEDYGQEGNSHNALDQLSNRIRNGGRNGLLGRRWKFDHVPRRWHGRRR